MLTLKWRKNSEKSHFKPNSIKLRLVPVCNLDDGVSQCSFSSCCILLYCITCKTFVWVCRTSFEHHLDLSVLKKKKWKLQFWQNFEILLLCWRQFISSAKKWCSRSQKLRHHRRGKKAIFQKVDHSFSRVNDLFCIFSVEVKKNKNQGQHNFNQ